ncbi:MAG: hypothetical protein KTR32_06125 [Granulosicoccus sp.]|nr:hypothetical protein [Granulosicoccus sp.]
MSHSNRHFEHDVLASLAITKGFCSALETSYSDLRTTCEEIIEAIDQGIDDEQIAALTKTENDCKFCLTRLVRSMEQLKIRLDQGKSSDRIGKEGCSEAVDE